MKHYKFRSGDAALTYQGHDYTVPADIVAGEYTPAKLARLYNAQGGPASFHVRASAPDDRMPPHLGGGIYADALTPLDDAEKGRLKRWVRKFRESALTAVKREAHSAQYQCIPDDGEPPT